MFLFIFIIILAAAVLLFINLHPVFGGNPSKEQKKLYQSFDNYADGKFLNQTQEKMDMGGISGVFSMMRDAVSGGKERNPSDQIPVSEIDWNIVKSNEDSLTWFGHSAFY